LRSDARISTGKFHVKIGGPVQVMRADETRAVDIVTFWADPGGKRFIELAQIIGVYAKPHLKHE
jgi:hypothetical protein